MLERKLDVQYVRPQDVAKMYSISPRVVYRAIWDNELVARKMSPQVWLIRPEDAQKWIESRFAAMEQNA